MQSNEDVGGLCINIARKWEPVDLDGQPITIEEQARRLEVLALFLETEVVDERFDYAGWVGTDWEGREDLSCGTVACALGWATVIPEFQAMGLSLNRTFAIPTIRGRQDACGSTVGAEGASQHIFGLSEYQHLCLFQGHPLWPAELTSLYPNHNKVIQGTKLHSAKKDEVIARIRQFIQLRKEGVV